MTKPNEIKHARIALRKVGNRVACYPDCERTKFLAAMDNAFLLKGAKMLGGEISDMSIACLVSEGFIVQFNDSTLAKQVKERIFS